ncbi:MAG: glycoside hydrolase family 3 C-terminal domain-containing protein [Treponema sp.]|nr:glycoside hydrolase family 3 C-terminal domain-containing protein [Treponema sp.]
MRDRQKCGGGVRNGIGKNGENPLSGLSLTRRRRAGFRLTNYAGFTGLCECQNVIINVVAEVLPHIVVVLHNGSPVKMPSIDNVKSLLELYFGGQAVEEAAVYLLFGEANPSGSWPRHSRCVLKTPLVQKSSRQRQGGLL